MLALSIQFKVSVDAAIAVAFKLLGAAVTAADGENVSTLLIPCAVECNPFITPAVKELETRVADAEDVGGTATVIV